MKKAWKKFYHEGFRWQGEITRSEFFWVYPFLCLVPILAILCLAGYLFMDNAFGSFLATLGCFLIVLHLILIYPSFVWLVKRWRNAGWSNFGWLSIFALWYCTFFAELVTHVEWWATLIQIIAWLILLVSVFIPTHHLKAKKNHPWMSIFFQK